MRTTSLATLLVLAGCAPTRSPAPPSEPVSEPPAQVTPTEAASVTVEPNPYPDCASTPLPSSTPHPTTATDGSPWEADPVIARNSFRLKACYHKALAVDAAAAGTVKVAVRVGPGGVAEASLHCANVRPASLATCVVAAYKSMKFQDPTGGVATFVVPNVFGLKTGPVEAVKP